MYLGNPGRFTTEGCTLMEGNRYMAGFGVTLGALVLAFCGPAVAGSDYIAELGPNDDIPIIDVHNHDAIDHRYLNAINLWNRFGVKQVVLFGNVSEPEAIPTDELALDAARRYPDRIIPFVAGVDIRTSAGLAYVRRQFARGAKGVGEIVGMSSGSPVVSRVAWKGENLLDGFLPQLYELCGQWHRPILLHIDPPNGQLEEVALLYPNTIFIFAHGNAFNTPERLHKLLRGTSNVLIDFFAGYTAYNDSAGLTLEDYVPLIEEYPNRFLLGSDSGYGVGYENAYIAMRRLLNLVRRDVAERIAYGNFKHLMCSADTECHTPTAAEATLKKASHTANPPGG
jgi:predicted TIM-barrel fold metal-dependent hydrolase